MSAVPKDAPKRNTDNKSLLNDLNQFDETSPSDHTTDSIIQCYDRWEYDNIELAASGLYQTNIPIHHEILGETVFELIQKYHPRPNIGKWWCI